MHFSSFVAAALGASIVAAHPGHDVAQEAAERRAFLDKHTKKDLSHCAAKIKARGLEARNVQRRAEHAASLLEKKGSLKHGKLLRRAWHEAQSEPPAATLD